MCNWQQVGWGVRWMRGCAASKLRWCPDLPQTLPKAVQAWHACLADTTLGSSA